MARSAYIYIVNGPARVNEVAFTVKHECLRYIRRTARNWHGWTVERHGDNRLGTPVTTWTVEEFLEVNP